MKINYKVFALFLFFLASTAYSQIQTPVKWYFSVNKISETEAELVLKASIDKHWHVYSMKQDDELIIPLTFNFEKNANYSLDGKIIEPTPKEMFDKTLETNARFYENEVTYRQKIKILSK